MTDDTERKLARHGFKPVPDLPGWYERETTGRDVDLWNKPLSDEERIKAAAVAKGKYWLPDVVDTKPTYTVAGREGYAPRRKSKFARDFEDSE